MPPNRFKRKIVEDEEDVSSTSHDIVNDSITTVNRVSNNVVVVPTKLFNSEECLFHQLIIIKLEDEYYIHRDLIHVCMNSRLDVMDNTVLPECAVRVLKKDELAGLVELISTQVYEKSLLKKRGLSEINHLDISLTRCSLNEMLFNLKYLLIQPWFLEFFKSNPLEYLKNVNNDNFQQVDQFKDNFDPSIFRAIIDLDFSEIIWRMESDLIFERRRKFLKYNLKSENEPTLSAAIVDTNTSLFPNTAKVMEDIHQCVFMFENSMHDKTSEFLDISLDNMRNLSLSVSSSKNLELYEKVCVQRFIIQSLKKLTRTCIQRNFTPNIEQVENFRCLALANIHMSNSCLKLFFTSALEMFFNDDLPNSLFTNLKNIDSLKKVYKDELLDLISSQSEK